MVQKQVEEEEEEPIQPKVAGNSSPEVTLELESRIQSLKGDGQPLPESVRAFFEPRFGFDFRQVRIHTNPQAAESAREVNALAFTIGHDVVFGSGQYIPETTAGERLLAHELTHVVQQSSLTPQSGSSRLQGRIQRLEIKATGTPPHGWALVPDKEMSGVQSAKDIVNKVIRLRSCINYFLKNCPEGNKNTAKEIFEAADIWKNPSADPHLYGQGERPGSNISYTQKAFKIGKWTVAGTIVHELMHNCGVADEKICEKALHYCGRLPQVPVGERDKGGIEPIRPGLSFFMEMVRRLSVRHDLIFPEMVGKGAPYGCLNGIIFIDPRNSFWTEAYTAQVERLAQEAVRACLGPGR